MIELFKHIFPHPDFHWLIAMYGTTIYTVLFLIIFVETGLVAMPFLPGDSLLFLAGLTANPGSTQMTPDAGFLSLTHLIPLLIVAAVAGDNCNYWIGRKIGLRIFQLKMKGKPLVKKKYLDDTHAFYEKYGTKAIIMARFVPFVRTFAPFAAGIGEMNYKKFLLFDIAGGILWICTLTFAGYLLGNVTFIREHIDLVCLLIILASVVPIIYQFVKARMAKKQ